MSETHTDDAEWFRPTPLEIATGIIYGEQAAAPLLNAEHVEQTPREALEHAVLQALQHGPCTVSFSGGRDSSAVLAIAMHVARREGLPLPVPISLRFPVHPEADENAWQELVVRHLGVTEWQRLEFRDDELDVVGPYARSVLKTFGLLWPANAHFHLPMAALCPGGTLLTGFGGDELLSPWPTWQRVNLVLTGNRRPRIRDLALIAVAYGPEAVRQLYAARRLKSTIGYPWLRPDAAEAARRRRVQDSAREPVRWDKALDRSWWRARYRLVTEDSLAKVGAMHRVRIVHPLTDQTFLNALARAGGRLGFQGRSAAMSLLFGDLLPPSIQERPTKGALAGAFWGRHSAEVIEKWNGEGVDTAIVNPVTLEATWRDCSTFTAQGYPDGRTLSLLQALTLLE